MLPSLTEFCNYSSHPTALFFFMAYLILSYRIGSPEEMAGVAAFLVSDDASYITAETIVANGGAPSRL